MRFPGTPSPMHGARSDARRHPGTTTSNVQSFSCTLGGYVSSTAGGRSSGRAPLSKRCDPDRNGRLTSHAAWPTADPPAPNTTAEMEWARVTCTCRAACCSRHDMHRARHDLRMAAVRTAATQIPNTNPFPTQPHELLTSASRQRHVALHPEVASRRQPRVITRKLRWHSANCIDVLRSVVLPRFQVRRWGSSLRSSKPMDAVSRVQSCPEYGTCVRHVAPLLAIHTSSRCMAPPCPQTWS